jgi:hypothetical protein
MSTKPGQVQFSTLSKLDDKLREVEEQRVFSRIEDISQSLLTYERRFSQVNAFFCLLKKSERFQQLSLKYGLQQLNKIIDEKTIYIEKAETLEAWLDCILASKDWYALNYAVDAWGKGGYGNKISYDYQAARMRAQGDIRRVFVLDGREDYEQLKRTMAKQQEIDVKVKWILRSELDQISDVTDCVKAIGSWDFSLVDNQSWLFKFHLDENKQIQGCTITTRPDLVKAANDVYKEAWVSGHKLDTSPQQQ